MSPELRVLRAPARTLDAMASAADEDGAWILVRRALLLMMAMGLTLSISSSTRASARVVVDGMISFAFLPIAEVIAVGAVFLRGDRRLPFARVAPMFLVTNAPWLLWILGFCVWQSMAPSIVLSREAERVILVSLIVPALWAAYLDLQFFRVVRGRGSVNAAWADLLTARAIGWACALGYFFGIAVWAEIVGSIR